VKELIKNGANVNAYNDYGTILIYASRGGHIDVVKELIKNGANVNAYGRWGTTALMWAADNGRFDTPHASHCERLVKELIKNGANVNAKDDEGCTVLSYAKYGTKLYYYLRKLIRSYDKNAYRDSSGSDSSEIDSSESGDVEMEDVYEKTTPKRKRSSSDDGGMSKLFKKANLSFGKTKNKAKKLGINLTVKQNGKRVYKTKKVLEKQIKNNIPTNTRKICKKYKIRLTVTRNGKRLYKTSKVLEGQIRRKMK
jgi:beta-glucosidase/6-phospho-beta-glucosidase/beta-galactosidase